MATGGRIRNAARSPSAAYHRPKTAGRGAGGYRTPTSHRQHQAHQQLTRRWARTCAPAPRRMERPWSEPHCGSCANGGVSQPRLVLYNSLVDRKVPFVPAAGPNSKEISWYTCGERGQGAAAAAAAACGGKGEGSLRGYCGQLHKGHARHSGSAERAASLVRNQVHPSAGAAAAAAAALAAAADPPATSPRSWHAQVPPSTTLRMWATRATTCRLTSCGGCWKITLGTPACELRARRRRCSCCCTNVPLPFLPACVWRQPASLPLLDGTAPHQTWRFLISQQALLGVCCRLQVAAISRVCSAPAPLPVGADGAASAPAVAAM